MTLTDPESPLPSLPVVVAQLVSLYASEEYTVDQVIGLLERDPPLSARLVRLANSAYYGFTRRVDTVRRAVVLLGGATVQAVALGATLLKACKGVRLPREAEDLWIHAYLCGTGCRYLALQLPRRSFRCKPDALFLTGLLHEVGKILFLAQDPLVYADILRDTQTEEELTAREVERYGRDHAEAGAELLDAWNFPRHIVSLVRHHRRGELRAELQTDWEIATVAHRTLVGAEAQPLGNVSEELVQDLQLYMDEALPRAEAFYRAIS